MFDKKFEDEKKDVIMVSWLAAIDRLKAVSTKVKERRSYHTLMETHKSLRQFLDQVSYLKRSIPPYMLLVLVQ